MKVTREQAVAFLDALLGREVMGEMVDRPNSPHAYTHLAAVLGKGNVIQVWSDGGYDEHYTRQPERLHMLIEYLEGVIAALKDERAGY